MIIHFIVIAICMAVIVFISIRFFKRIKTIQTKSQEIGRTVLAITLISLVYFLFFFPQLLNTLNLQSHAVAVTGKTVRWIDTGDSRRIEFSFTVDKATYTSQCDVVYNGQEIEHIQCPDGIYPVIYDSLDPENAVMDFKTAGK